MASRTSDLAVCKKNKLSFPVFKDALDFGNDWRIHDGLLEHLIGVDEFAKVKRSQPYERYPSHPETDPLYILAELNNIDKHRTILVLDNRLDIYGTTAEDFAVSKEPMEPGTERFRVTWPILLPPGKVNMDEVSVRVMFAETNGLCDGVPVTRILSECASSVATIIDDFARFF